MSDSQLTDLEQACREVAREVLWRNGASSADVVETLAAKFLRIAEEHQDFVRQRRETDDVIANAVRYIAHVHAIPPSGTDPRWFRDTLSVLMELAVPNMALTAPAAIFLPDLQHGLQESLSQVPESRLNMRIEEDDAIELKRMQAAGVEHGAASDLLDLLEKIYYGDALDQEDKRLLYLAAVAAPLTRAERAS